MSTFKPTFAAAFGTLLAAASCTLITDVDRTKIPTDSGTAGSAGTGGDASAGTAGSGGTSGSGGDAGDGGSAPEGGSGGGSSGTNGEAGSAGGGAEVCIQATGNLTLEPDVQIADGDSFELADGVSDTIRFEFNCEGSQVCTPRTSGGDVEGVTDGSIDVRFDGAADHVSIAEAIVTAVNDVADELAISASLQVENDGAGGQGGEGDGGTGGDGASPAGNGGSGNPPATGPATVLLTNERYGSLGNTRIDDSVGNPLFTNADMQGGAATNCSMSPTLCESDDDCADSCDTGTNLCE